MSPDAFRLLIVSPVTSGFNLKSGATRAIFASCALLLGSPAVADQCPYLDHYMAPFDLPVETWPTPIVGPQSVKMRLVGPDECRIVDERAVENAKGVRYRQITIGISGSVFGYAPVNSLVVPPLGTGEKGEGQEFFFTDHAFIWQARGIMGPFVPGVVQYQYTEETPSSVEILIPDDASDWNGSVWVLAHGGGRFPPLKLPSRRADQFSRYLEASQSAGALIDEGYAVVWTRRDAATSEESSIPVTNVARLDNGLTRGGVGKPGMALNENLALLRDYTVISRRFIEEELGKEAQAVFYRGHSAGGAMGRSFALVPGMNSDHQGRKLFDGFYLDDSAGGRGAPTYFWTAEVVDEHGTFRLKPSENDYLTFDTDSQTAFLAPVVETIHGAYAGGRTSTVPRIFKRVPALYYEYKRENARLNIEKGLDHIWKTYEIADVSHFDAAGFADEWPAIAKETIDIGGVAVALERALANWVLHGKEPPHMRVDAADVWELDPDAGPAIRLPESACPRGIYRTYMTLPDGTSAGTSVAIFVPYLTEPRPQINDHQQRPPGFKEEWLEPLDSQGYLVDMMGSHQRMTRPTIQQAWHMRFRHGYDTGTLRPHEELTRERYARCVNAVAAQLREDRLLTDRALEWYQNRAQTDYIGSGE